MNALLKCIQWTVALVFAIAAGLKLAWMARRVDATTDAQTMFSGLQVWLQWVLIGLELGLAVWLASGWQTRWGALAAIVLLSTFMAAILVEMGAPNPQSCGCMGVVSLRSAMQSLWVMLSGDGAMLLGMLWVYFATLGGKPRPPAAA